MRSLLLFILIVIFSSIATAEHSCDDCSLPQLMQNLKKSTKPDTNRINALVDIGTYYSYKYPYTPAPHDLDSAGKYLQLARQLNNKVNDQNFKLYVDEFMGAWYIETGQIQNGIDLMLSASDGYHKMKDNSHDATFLSALTDWLTWRSNITRTNDQPLNQLNPPLSLCIKGCLQALSRYKRTGFHDAFRLYSNISNIYANAGDTKNQLVYLLEGAKSMDSKTTLDGIDVFYFSIGQLYEKLKNYDRSLFWAQKAIRMDVKKATGDETESDDLFYQSLGLNIRDLLQLNRAHEALSLLKRNVILIPPKDNLQKSRVNRYYGDCYAALKQYPKAESYYLKMMRSGDIGRSLLSKQTFFANNCEAIINFYVTSKQYTKASPYLKSLSALPVNYLGFDKMQRAQNSKFKIDSASGNYKAAIADYQKLTMMQDSLNNGDNYRQLTELQVKYETYKKEQSISNLKKNAIIQKGELQKTGLQRNITFGGIAMMLVIAGLVYAGYRGKSKSNIELKIKQQEINEQNVTLQRLVTDKDDLLAEKDWLLKEVHHRVKNNLQIVMSLLSSQSAYLENTAAIEAIRESQNRVQAISLIHQKLYKGNNVASINMPAYVADLLAYLEDSFNTRKPNLRFEQLVEPFNLDLAQAVPIGLILNESVTNAIKYAFEDQGGQIIVALQLIRDDTLLLTIADNGKGLPADFDPQNTTTLGMEMMKALSKQLGGDFKIENIGGVRISIEFEIERVWSGLGVKSYRNS